MALPDNVLLYEVRNEVAHITLNRPDKLNVINSALATALMNIWPRFEADDTARVAIVSGAGRSFCAGRDITPGAIDPKVLYQGHRAQPNNGIDVFKPMIAAVHGHVMGAGYALGVWNCDITVAGKSAVFGLPEAKAGTASTPQEYKPYLPFKISLELTLLGWRGGRMLNADRAYQLGLVNQVVEDADLQAEALRWAEMLKQIPPLYVKSIKKGHYEAVHRRITAHEREYVEFVLPQEQSEDIQEARAAFREKRQPKFKGK